MTATTSTRSRSLAPGQAQEDSTFCQEVKTLAILLLSAVTAHSQQSVSGSQEDDWLPISDGYVWPEPAEKAPDFRPEHKKLSELKESQRIAIKDNWPDEVMPETVYMAEIDLNGDGQPEIFVEVPALGGSGGAFFEILSTKDETADGVGPII